MFFSRNDSTPRRSPPQRSVSRTIAIISLFVVTGSASIAFGQKTVGPGQSHEHIKPGEQELPRLDDAETDDDDDDDRAQRERDGESSDEGDGDGNDEGDEAKGEREWVREFDSVDVERIDPSDFSQTAKPGADTGIRTEGDELPEPADEDQLRSTVDQVASQVVQVAAVQTPPSPYRADPMTHFGHAVWVQADEAKSPALITPLNWLEEADQVFVIPNSIARSSRDQSEWQDVHRRSLESVTAGKSNAQWLQDHRDKLVEVEAQRPDEHANLVTLAPANNKELEGPSDEMTIFDVDDEGLFRVYGYTPYFGDSLVSTTIERRHPDRESLAFYWKTTFPAILGAPLVTEDGKLVAINTFRHPQNEDVFLAIPSEAVATYLNRAD